MYHASAGSFKNETESDDATALWKFGQAVYEAGRSFSFSSIVVPFVAHFPDRQSLRKI